MKKNIAIGILLMVSVITTACQETFKPVSGEIAGFQTAYIYYEGEIKESDVKGLSLKPHRFLVGADAKDGRLELIVDRQSLFELDEHYTVQFPGREPLLLQPRGILDRLHSRRPLGHYRENGDHVFRVFAPRAKIVQTVIYQDLNHLNGTEYGMKRNEDGTWDLRINRDLTGKYYCYRITGPEGEHELFDNKITVADPYSQAVATKNHYLQDARTLILPEIEFDWEGDRWQKIDSRDLLIYEMHVRDMTAHPSSGVSGELRGTYPGLTGLNQKGGLPYLKKLGINAVELLPAQDFANVEIPFKDSKAPVYNTWNPYERNHWGYMTSYFFAPESYYATGGTMLPGKYNGADGRQVQQFKQMVKDFHDEGIAVIMDVVYNHVSQYDYNPFKYIDKSYYFRLDENGDFLSVSGCGNDFKTERAMARRMIIESVKFWMLEYHVDGFRFDLARMIDWKTCEEIIAEARKINPDVIIIAEPWGGGYDPDGFSDRDWASWNDQFRNGIKGQNPEDGHGFIFGKWQGENDRKSLQRYLMGSLREYGGQFVKVGHSVNYLESHDDHTLGDFIRIALKDVDPHEPVEDLQSHHQLTVKQLKVAKLAALALFVSQGPLMIHSGQEFGRSKVIAPTSAPDSAVGLIDHNSYEKDNETNWINYQHAEQNSELFSYYQQLAQMRKSHVALRHAEPQDFKFEKTKDPFFLVFHIQTADEHLLIALNGNSKKGHYLSLPEGRWTLLANEEAANQNTAVSSTRMTVPATSGLVLKSVAPAELN